MADRRRTRELRARLRHGDLVDLIGGVSRKVLTQTLRRLERHGLVVRQVYAEAPPRVEYRLTELGQTLKEPIIALTTWARVNGEAVIGSDREGGLSGEVGDDVVRQGS